MAAFAAATLLGMGTASADVRVETATKFYTIKGKSGVDLIRNMDRRGPRSGLMARAIAQTSYTVGWEFGWDRDGSSCRLRSADGLLDVTYTYPKLSGGQTAAVVRRWNRFIKGVTIHEEHHGKLAHQMVRSAERAVAGIKTRNDPRCRKAQAEAKKRIGKVYAQYEARQVKFDKIEHAQGGNVFRLLSGLAGER